MQGKKLEALSRINKVSGDIALIMADINAHNHQWDDRSNVCGIRLNNLANKHEYTIRALENPLVRSARCVRNLDLLVTKN